MCPPWRWRRRSAARGRRRRRADQSVVSATIYPSSEGNVSHATVGLQALAACPEYAGSNPIYLYPPGQPFQLSQSTWPLSTIINCGLQVPIGDVNDVQVLSPNHGFQAPLSNADLTDPSRYQDPQAPDALPVISVDGNENQTTYVRPFRGGTDTNARDEVTETGAPITLVVYANGAPLIVHASARTAVLDGDRDDGEAQRHGADRRRRPGRAIRTDLELDLRRRGHLVRGIPDAPVRGRQL